MFKFQIKICPKCFWAYKGFFKKCPACKQRKETGSYPNDISVTEFLAETDGGKERDNINPTKETKMATKKKAPVKKAAPKKAVAKKAVKKTVAKKK